MEKVLIGGFLREVCILTDFKACKACDVKVPVGKKFYFYTSSLVCLVDNRGLKYQRFICTSV